MTRKYHKLLNRQIQKFFSNDEVRNDPKLQKFLSHIDDSYKNFEKDKKLSERAFSLAESEYNEINYKLTQEKENTDKIIRKVLDSIRSIAPEIDIKKLSSEKDFLGIVDFLDQQVKRRQEVEEKLHKAIETANKASNAKTEFLATMSHEIRSPLNVITSLTHILLDEKYYKHQEENLEVLDIASNNLLHLINDILDFSKIESGKLQLHHHSFDILTMMKELQKATLTLAEEKGLFLDMHLSENLPSSIITDSQRLRQILMNLISNAIKFTQKGGVTISLSSKPSKKENSSILVFKVQDTGIGISDKDQSLVFENFTQAQNNYKTSKEGTGLGLSISKHLLQLLGSKIQLKSELNKGSTFYFNLEVSLGNPDENKILKRKLEKDLNNANILVVDDMNFNRMVMRKILTKWNVHLDFAINGKEAVDKIFKNQYDLVLMDLQMPEMNGIEATLLVREKCQELPIIALTASSDEKTKKKVMNAGMNGFVTKPLNPTLLYKCIEKNLQKINHPY